ncbi:MAG: hypothetical protein EBT69_07815 [Verrucomicrobia bacterium]|nr:hypothetical protein [Verrucomicrobiota bacterium]
MHKAPNEVYSPQKNCHHGNEAGNGILNHALRYSKQEGRKRMGDEVLVQDEGERKAGWGGI